MRMAKAADSKAQSGPDPRNELVDHLPALRAFALSLTRESASADDLVQDPHARKLPADAAVLVTHRHPNMRSHSGQMAFPGGRKSDQVDALSRAFAYLAPAGAKLDRFKAIAGVA